MQNKKTKMTIKQLSLIIPVLAVVLFLAVPWVKAIEVGDIPQQVEDTHLTEPENIDLDPWVEDLEIPWQLTFLPDSDRALVTERPGRIRLIENGELQDDVYAFIDTDHYGEGGLMGLTHHPDFPDQPYIYIMYTYQDDTGEHFNRVSRLTDQGQEAADEEILIDHIPAARNHNGGRLRFGPDDKLYITTGDTWERQKSQDPENLAGKILRADAEGSIPEDNPRADSYVYSLGHRNPQGLAWNEQGHLFISDHGPSGESGLQAKDMIKVIQPGGNYGWPEQIGYFEDSEFLNPLIMWADAAVPPSGAHFVDGDLFVATLRSRALVKISLEHSSGYDYRVTGIEHWFSESPYSGIFGRLRDVTADREGNLYVLTSNRDGRGEPRPGDDRIYKIELD